MKATPDAVRIWYVQVKFVFPPCTVHDVRYVRSFVGAPCHLDPEKDWQALLTTEWERGDHGSRTFIRMT